MGGGGGLQRSEVSELTYLNELVMLIKETNLQHP